MGGFVMFTINDICNIAIQIERNGEKTYRSASRKTDDLQLAHLLDWMADEELRHIRLFQAFQLESPVSPEHDEIETMGRALLREMMKNQTFSLEGDQLLTAVDMTGLLTRSLEFEKDTILFYEMLRSFIDKGETLDQLNTIIAEECGHVEQLEKLKALYVTRANH